MKTVFSNKALAFQFIALMLLSIVTLFTGVAHAKNTSWYGPGFHGRLTANGERFNQNDLTAAHRTLPFGTLLKVTNSKNGKSVVVRINDRGPFHKHRYLDLSKAAHLAIDCNLCHTTYEIVKQGDGATFHGGKKSVKKATKVVTKKTTKKTTKKVSKYNQVGKKSTKR